MNGRNQGFTLVELLVVVVIIGILATIAAGKLQEVREKSFVATLENDLRTLVVQQEIYHGTRNTYGDLASLTDFTPSRGVNISIGYLQSTGWAATATHAGLSARNCGVFVGTAGPGDAPPATQESRIACTP